MARRPGFSPLKTVERIIQKGSYDPRDEMIQKLKDELIKVRGKQRELAISENMVRQIYERHRLLTAQKVKSQEQGKFAIDQSLRTMGALKKQVQLLKAELKNYHAQLTQIQEQQNSFKRTLNEKNVDIEKLRKQSYIFMEQNQKLVIQGQRLNTQFQQASFQQRRIQQRIRDYEARNSQITNKLTAVKSFINELSIQNQGLKDTLKNYQTKNTGITDNLQKKQIKLDQLQYVYSQRHELIKACVQNYVEMQHQNEKSVKQTKHKLSLLKMQTQKHGELGSTISKVQRRTGQEQKQIILIKDEMNELDRNNVKLRKDLNNCNQHLQNLMKNNAILQAELDGMVRQDEEVVAVLKRKKIMPNLENFQTIRSSRQTYRQNAGRY